MCATVLRLLVLCARLEHLGLLRRQRFLRHSKSSSYLYLHCFPGRFTHVRNLQVMYEFLYTAIGQSIAAYTPNAVFASLINPLVIVTLVSFCGVVVPYSQIQPFWRYW
jgi:hypothetical protein